MARIAFPSKGIIYDTDKQTGQLHQVANRITLGSGSCEKCVVVEVVHNDRVGYSYTLVGLKTLVRFSTRFIFDERDSASGVIADLEYPSFMAADQVEALIARAMAASLERERLAAIAARRLHRGALIVDYSEKALAIFTDDPADAAVLEHIRAKRNPSLKYKGRKVAGWIFPKCRQEQLAAVVTM